MFFPLFVFVEIFLKDTIGGFIQANFFLFDAGRRADDLFEAMLPQGVIVRSMSAYGYPDYIRINAGLPEENERFLAALDRVLAR